jgi:CheY-like chemotaxis protein
MHGWCIAGGRSVAKILVADDNSNIQKMVGLALKDQGIDVVAVGNGEAAVRKISDIRPDLVLADVFMPVRNGYEVCQYVKTDPTLAHIPVILLVGAFDPLDEQEAQRVGADGVLKKPFVPPDPLISMVKSALQRAGVAHGNAVAAKTPQPEALKASDLMTPGHGGIPMVGSTAIQNAASMTPIAPLDQESFVDEAPARPAPLRIDSGSQAVAFGSLLEAPTDQKDEGLAFLPPANPEFATERDWRDEDEKEADEEDEGEKPAAPWRPEAAESYPDAGPGAAKDWRSGSFEQIQARKAKDWEPAEEKPELIETAPAASHSVSVGQQATAGISEATTAIPVAETKVWAPAAASLASQEKSLTETATALEEVTRAHEPEHSAAEAVVASGREAKQEEQEKKGSKDSWFSVPANPWNAEMEKGNRLASAWDAAVTTATPPVSSNGTEKATEEVSETTRKVIEEAALPAATVDAIREEAAFVAEEDATLVPEAQNADGTPVYAHDEPAEIAAPTATSNMDDLVAKVLAKMSPEVLQAVTREILRPVVEAMVQEELKSKKS